MNPIDIKIELMRRGITQTQIANDLNVTLQAVNQVIHRKVVSKRISEYINKLISTPMAA